MTGTRVMLALAGGLLWADTAMSANELRFSDIEARIAAVEQKTSAIPGLKAAAFLSDEEIDAIAPNESVGTATEDEEVTSPGTSSGSSYQGGSLFRDSNECGGVCECGSTCEGGTACTAASGCGGPMGCGNGYNNGGVYAGAQLLWLRPHVLENAVGKLAEKYELSPRFIAGFESAGGGGGRVRYWTYGRTTTILSDEPDIRFEFDVVDVEATGTFRSKRSELTIGGGMRFANVEIVYDDEPISNNMPGVTFSADGRTMICGECGRQWAAICGARWSILGSDWEGSDDALIEPIRDDNVVVQELYGGVEYLRHYGNYDVYTRLLFEVQNWHSDAMSQFAGADSIGFIGPGWELGMNF